MTKMMMTMTFFVIHCLNIDNNNVQKLGNFSIRIANGHSWLLITPYLGLLLYVLAWRKVRWLASYFKIYRQSLVKIIFGNFSTNFISRQNYLTSHFPALMNVNDQSSTTLGFSVMKKLETRTHSRTLFNQICLERENKSEKFFVKCYFYKTQKHSNKTRNH